MCPERFGSLKERDEHEKLQHLADYSFCNQCRRHFSHPQEYLHHMRSFHDVISHHKIIQSKAVRIHQNAYGIHVQNRNVGYMTIPSFPRSFAPTTDSLCFARSPALVYSLPSSLESYLSMISFKLYPWCAAVTLRHGLERDSSLLIERR